MEWAFQIWMCLPLLTLLLKVHSEIEQCSSQSGVEKQLPMCRNNGKQQYALNTSLLTLHMAYTSLLHIYISKDMKHWV